MIFREEGAYSASNDTLIPAAYVLILHSRSLDLSKQSIVAVGHLRQGSAGLNRIRRNPDVCSEIGRLPLAVLTVVGE
jgi:hypothetical protein